VQEEEKQAGPLGSVEQLPLPDRPKVGWVTLVTALLAVAAISYLLSSFPVRPRQNRPQLHLIVCKSNLKNLAAALEMYASDNADNYPESLDKLTEHNYLKSIPTCPAAGKMTYLDYQVSTRPDCFSVSCCGDNHKRAFIGFNADSTGIPRYNAELGLTHIP